MRGKYIFHRLFFVAVYFISILIGNAFVVNEEVNAAPFPSSKMSHTPSARTDPVTIPLKAPWLAGVTFHMGGKNDGSFYGEFLHKNIDHYALDFNADYSKDTQPVNDKYVLAAAVADGEILYADWDPIGYGYTVLIGHVFGPNGGYESRYAHLRKDSLRVKQGDKVTQGTPLGYIDCTGMDKCKEHLHFALYFCGKDLEECRKDNVNIVAQKPEPLEGYVNFSDGGELTSTNYGVGIEEYKCENGRNCLPLEEWNRLYHESFAITYKKLGGQYQLFGSSLGFVKKYENTNYLHQEFGEFLYDPNSPYYSISATLLESNGVAYHLLGPIWEQYKMEGGPLGRLGEPLTDTYEWTETSSPVIGYRNDFANGSIIWKTDGTIETLDASNTDWKLTFYLLANFTNPLVTRYDKTLNFTWTPNDKYSQLYMKTFSSGNFSALEAERNDKSSSYSKTQVEVSAQGYATVFLNNTKIEPVIESPDAVTSQTYSKNRIKPQQVKVRFWQEQYKEAKLAVDASQSSIISGSILNLFTMRDLPQYPQIVYADYTPPSYYEQQPTSSTETVLVFDTSGSMSDSDSSGISKIEAAQRAGIQILNVIEAENVALGASDQIGVASYNYTANVDSPMTTDVTLLKDTLLGLSANGRTAMADGLQTGINLFSSGSGNKVLILLSDGLPNISLNSGSSLNYDEIKQQVIDLATQAGQQNICVNTVGFGDPNQGNDSIDEEFLREVASASGCGKYYSAINAIELANVYVELRHTSTGVIQFKQTGQITAGEQKNLGTVQIPDYQELFLLTVNWPGSKLQPVVIDPSGITVDNSYSGVSISESSTLISYILNSPMPGNWQLELIGIDVPEGLTDYNAILSTRAGVIPTPVPTPVPTPAPVSPTGGVSIFVVLLVLAASGIAIFSYSNVLKRAGKKTVLADASGGKLYGRTGAYRQKIIALHDGFVIGRGELCDLKLSDSSVSRRHTQFRFAQGSWYVQDLGSSRGTYVNGARTNAIKLTSGDTISIGNDTFTFLSNSQ